jgi:uncharacterized membrane protein
MPRSPWITWSVVLGFALGGFFDGILLHQILQWHHLLSLVPGMDDLRLLVLWDGYFHLLMYAIALAALWGLWRAYRRLARAPGPTALAAAVLLGFGVWNVIDSVLSHWVLEIHHIRLDAANPLAWDVAWLAVFGMGPIVGWALLRRSGTSDPGNPATALLLLALLTGGAGAWAARQPPNQPYTTVVFAPGTTPAQVFGALDALDARLVWTDRPMGVVVVAVPAAKRWAFYRHGALLVGGTGVAAGCVTWSRA